jgi:acetamidase/formamidase
VSHEKRRDRPQQAADRPAQHRSQSVDLRVSNVVDVPNYVVSALIPEAIFER